MSNDTWLKEHIKKGRTLTTKIIKIGQKFENPSLIDHDDNWINIKAKLILWIEQLALLIDSLRDTIQHYDFSNDEELRKTLYTLLVNIEGFFLTNYYKCPSLEEEEEMYDSGYYVVNENAKKPKLGLLTILFWEMSRLCYVLFFPRRHQLFSESIDEIKRLTLMNIKRIDKSILKVNNSSRERKRRNEAKITNNDPSQEARKLKSKFFIDCDDINEMCRSINEMETAFYMFCRSWNIYNFDKTSEKYLRALLGIQGFFFTFPLNEKFYDGKGFSHVFNDQYDNNQTKEKDLNHGISTMDIDGEDYIGMEYAPKEREHTRTSEKLCVPNINYVLKSKYRYIALLERLYMAKDITVIDFNYTPLSDIITWKSIIKGWCERNVTNLSNDLSSKVREFVMRLNLPIGDHKWFEICHPGMTPTLDSIIEGLYPFKFEALGEIANRKLIDVLFDNEPQNVAIREYLVLLLIDNLIGMELFTKIRIDSATLVKSNMNETIKDSPMPLLVYIPPRHVLYWHTIKEVRDGEGNEIQTPSYGYADMHIYNDIYVMVALWIVLYMENVKKKKNDKNKKNELFDKLTTIFEHKQATDANLDYDKVDNSRELRTHLEDHHNKETMILSSQNRKRLPKPINSIII